MSESRAETEVSRLAASLSRVQRLETDRAERLARRIAEGDDDIWEAALTWASTGEMPTEPAIEGQTPARLSARLSPSQTFTALIGLRSDPERALSALRHSPHDLPRKKEV
jgi:hypothetical protein